jgi:NAD+ synthase (glutamine-hydrolysing)
MDDGDESMDALAWRAVTRGIQDYCRKNGFEKVWLGLSGGIDSALVLAIAVDALGAENVTAVRLPSRYTRTCPTTWPPNRRGAGREAQAVPIERRSGPDRRAGADVRRFRADVTEETCNRAAAARS